MATFSTKSLHCPGGVPKNKKTTDFGLFRAHLCQNSKIFVFLVFLVAPQEMATFSTKSLHFPGKKKVPKNKKNKDFGLFRPHLCQDSKIFVFLVFLVAPQEMATFSTKSLHFPGKKKVPKNKKNKDFGLFRPHLCQDSKIFVFLVFLVAPQEMATFSTKSLHFPGKKKVPKNKKNKDFGLFRTHLCQDSKIFVFLVFLVAPQEMATFSTKSLYCPGAVPKNKKNKNFGLFRPHLRQDSKIFGYFFLVAPQEMATFPLKACIFLEGLPTK